VEVVRHLQAASRSVRDALDAVQGGSEMGFRPRRVERELLGIIGALRHVGSVGPIHGGDIDLMPEDDIAEMRRKEREDRRVRRETREVTDG
jgi:hypothetical protein